MAPAMRVIVLSVLVVCTATQYSRTRDRTGNERDTAGNDRRARGCNKSCPPNNVCEEQICQVCVPEAPTCKTWRCKDNQKCVDTRNGPVCKQLTCEDIRCAAETICNELPDGPDCVPDIPSCEGFFCHRGTNCHVRDGHPICLPNTCQVRRCPLSLTCIDTPDGALCRRGNKTRGCSNRYCPLNSKCIDTSPEGPHCVKI